jgi:hypothetical protein
VTLSAFVHYAISPESAKVLRREQFLAVEADGEAVRVTCFLNEIHHSQGGKIAEATVFIAAVWPDGTLASALST